MRVALEGEHVGRHAVEERAVVADDDRAAGIGFQRVFQRPVSISTVGAAPRLAAAILSP